MSSSTVTTAGSGNTVKTSFPLGAYLGYPSLTATGEATFEASYDSFVSTMGAAPSFIDVGFDITSPVSTWVASASGSAQAFATLADTEGTTPVISLPMASTAAGSLSADSQYKLFASGQYDSVLQGIVKAWANNGFQNLVFRPGWEMNVAGGPTYAGSDAQSQADWVSAFQHIYTVLHQAAAADGVSVQVVWNPSASNYGGTSTLTNLYPGNNYVDVIGTDVYADAFPYSDYSSTSYHDWATGVEDATLAQFIANPINQEHYWSDPAANQWVSDASSSGALSLTTLMAFAQAQGKPFAIPEAGAGNSTAGHDVTDDAAYPAWLWQQLVTAQASGLTVSFVNLFDVNGVGSYEFSQASDGKPLEAAAWAKYFGAGSNTLTIPTATTGVIAGQVTAGTQIGTAVGGATVSLLGSSGTVLATTTTSSAGTYSFIGLAAGTYTVRETPPSGYAVLPGFSATTAAITVTAGNISAPPSLKLSGVGSITGTELLGSTPLAGATVTLLASNASGYYTAATTKTSSTGAYSFSSLYALTYEIKFTAPSGDSLQSGPASSSSGITSPITLNATPGQTVTLAAEILSNASTIIATAVITGQVAAGAGTGTAIGGVILSLLGSSGTVLATTTTNSTGSYSFTGLAAGTYTVRDTPPAGYAIQPGSSTTTAAIIVATAATATAPSLKLAGVGSISGTELLGSAPLAGATVTLLASGASGYYAAATTTTSSTGAYSFSNLYALNYEIKFTAPSGDTLQSGPATSSTGITSPIAITGTPGQTVALAAEITATNTATVSGTGQTLTRADGNYTVTGTASNSTITLGSGNQTVTLTGSGDTITIGSGTSVITAKGGHDTIHTGGGSATISVTAGGNLLDTGSGMNFITTDGAANDTFMLNAVGQELTTISGFSISHGDVVDLNHALAGLNVTANLSNIDNFVTSVVSGGNTTLMVDPTGNHGTATSIGVLTGISTTIDQLVAGGHVSIV